MRLAGMAASGWWLLPAVAACTSDNWFPPDTNVPQDAQSSAPEASAPASSQNEASTSGDAAASDDSSQGDAAVPITDARVDAEDGSSSASNCKGSGLALCEDFESGMLDPGTWAMASDNGGGATIAIDTVRAKRGTHSLHAHVSQGAAGQSANARIVEKKTFPALANGIYGRAFLYVVGTPPGKHTPLVGAEELSPNYYYYGTHIKFGAFYAVQAGSGVDEGFTSSTHIVQNQWTCLEWYYGGAAIRTWTDGTELTDIHETNWRTASFQDVLIGLAEEDPSTVGAGGFDVWYDDVALNPTRIGCTD